MAIMHFRPKAILYLLCISFDIGLFGNILFSYFKNRNLQKNPLHYLKDEQGGEGEEDIGAKYCRPRF